MAQLHSTIRDLRDEEVSASEARNERMDEVRQSDHGCAIPTTFTTTAMQCPIPNQIAKRRLHRDIDLEDPSDGLVLCLLIGRYPNRVLI